MGMPLFHSDTMSDEERAGALLTGQPIDRVPFNLFGLAYLGVNAGYTVMEWYTDMQKAVDSGRMTSEQYGAMWLPFGGYPALGPRELGGEVTWPTSEFSQCPNVEPAVKTEEEAWTLEMPDPETLKTLGFVPDFMEAARITKEAGVPYCVPGYGPWTTAGNIVGLDRLCRWTIKKPDLAHHVVRYATDFLVQVMQIVRDIVGPEHFWPLNSTASAANVIISPKGFKEFVLPYLIDYHTKLIEMGAPSITFHLCGEQNLNYEFYPQVPLPPLSIISVSHEVDLDKASASFPDNMICGNIEPALFQTGSGDEVYESCRIAIEKGKKHKRGFILSPGCEMPPHAIPHNVWMMSKAVNDFGYYN